MRKTLTKHFHWASSTVILASAFWLILTLGAVAQGIKELPIVEKPRERSSADRVVIKTVPAQPSKGVLAVVLDPIVNGQVTVKDSTGRIISKLEADKDGQAEIQLARNKTYLVEASYPGFLGATGKSKPLKNSEVIRLRLTPQFAKLVLNGLPPNAQVLIDDQSRATADRIGVATINDLKPGDHSLIVRHPEYNDYVDSLKGLEAGATANWRISPVRVAKLTIQGTPGATVMIDGAMQGKIQPDGTVRIDYELERTVERTISVELPGYQTWTKTELLSPGPKTIEAKLNPIVTSAGESDFFTASLALWKAPKSWELVTVGNNKRLRVKGEELGLLKDKVYRDIDKESNFTIWLEDGKGATWAVKADPEGRSYYLFHLSGPKSTALTPKKFYTYAVIDGGAPVEVSTPFPVLMELDMKSSYLINIEISGDRFLHWITSNETGERVELGAWTNTTPTKDRFLYGTFGFRSLYGEIFAVDDFSLEPKKP